MQTNRCTHGIGGVDGEWMHRCMGEGMDPWIPWIDNKVARWLEWWIGMDGLEWMDWNGWIEYIVWRNGDPYTDTGERVCGGAQELLWLPRFILRGSTSTPAAFGSFGFYTMQLTSSLPKSSLDRQWMYAGTWGKVLAWKLRTNQTQTTQHRAPETERLVIFGQDFPNDLPYPQPHYSHLGRGKCLQFCMNIERLKHCIFTVKEAPHTRISRIKM